MEIPLIGRGEVAVLEPWQPNIHLPSFKELVRVFRDIMLMGDMTNTEESNYLTHRFKNGTAMSQLTNSYIGLFSASPGETGGGTELSGSGYARLNMVSTDWGAVSAGEPSTIANSAQKNYATATADWLTALAIGVFDASTVGNLLFFKTLATSKTVLNGDTAKFNASSLAIGIG